MTVRDLLEFYEIRNASDSVLGLWLDMECRIDTRIDKNLLFSKMLEEVGTMTPLYNTTQVFQKFSENFFNAHYLTFRRRIDVLFAKYNPLYDYDLYTDEVTGTTQESDAETVTNAGSQSHATSEHTTSAYNSDEYEPRDKTVSNSNVTSDSNVKGTANMSQDVDRNRHDYGRRGKAQELVREELDIALEMNIYSYICNLYSQHLCLSVY